MATAPTILEYAYKVEARAGAGLGSFRLANFIGYVEVTTTGAKEFPVYILPQRTLEQTEAPVPLVLTTAELGDFCITGVQYRIPAGLVATTGDKLRLTAGSRATAGATSAAAASSTFATAVVSAYADFINDGTFSSTILGKHTSDVTPKLYSVTPAVGQTPEADGANISVATGVKRIPVVISIAFNKGIVSCPDFEVIDAALKAKTEV